MTSCLFIVYRSSDGVSPLGGNDVVPPAAAEVPRVVPPAALEVPRGVTFRSRGLALKECAAHGKQQ